MSELILPDGYQRPPEIEDTVDYEVQVCLGCIPLGEDFKFNLDPTYLVSPYTPINMFIHQSFIKLRHECSRRDPSWWWNIWSTRKLTIPAALAERLKETAGIEPGPVTTDPERRTRR